MNGDCFLRAGFVGGAAPPGSEFTVFPTGKTGGGSKGMWSERTPPPRGPGRACSLALILGTVETRWKLSDKKAEMEMAKGEDELSGKCSTRH